MDTQLHFVSTDRCKLPQPARGVVLPSAPGPPQEPDRREERKVTAMSFPSCDTCGIPETDSHLAFGHDPALAVMERRQRVKPSIRPLVPRKAPRPRTGFLQRLVAFLGL